MIVFININKFLNKVITYLKIKTTHNGKAD